MTRSALFIPTLALVAAFGCGGRESGTTGSTSSGSANGSISGMSAGTGAANGSGAGTSGGPVGDIGMAAGSAVICATVQASSYNQACAVDSDCTLTGGNVTGCQCCPYGAINVTALPAYDANLAVALAPFDAGFATCTCGPGPAPALPCCAKGLCQVGTSCAGATIVPDIDASDEDVAALADGDVSDAATGCLAAGGQCVPYIENSRSCLAIGFQNCGTGAACCLDVCDANAAVIRASSYDQTCAVDTDCTAISEGSTCNACNFACPNAVINVNALPQYSSATVSLYPAAGDLCPSSCGPAMRTCCRGGTCHLGSPLISDPTCPYPGAQPVDSGADSGDAGPE